MAEIGTIVYRPSTPVDAAPFASVPSYDFPIIPVWPLCQVGDDLVAVLVVALPPAVQPVDADDGAQDCRACRR